MLNRDSRYERVTCSIAERSERSPEERVIPITCPARTCRSSTKAREFASRVSRIFRGSARVRPSDSQSRSDSLTIACTYVLYTHDHPNREPPGVRTRDRRKQARTCRAWPWRSVTNQILSSRTHENDSYSFVRRVRDDRGEIFFSRVLRDSDRADLSKSSRRKSR